MIETAHLIEGIIGGGVLLVLGLIMKGFKNEIDCKLDERVYATERKMILDQLEDGRRTFAKIDAKLEQQTHTLHRLDTVTQLISQKLDCNDRQNPEERR